MVEVKKHGILLEKTERGFENAAAFNPGVIMENGEIHLFYRAVRQGDFSSIGYCKLESPTKVESRLPYPFLIPGVDKEKHGMEDPRIVKIDDTFYLTYTAYDGINALGALATSKDLKKFTKEGIIVPMFTYADFDYYIECCSGISDKYLRFYNLFKKRGGKESTQNFIVWDKDVVFFPRKLNGKFAFLHRLYPSIQIVYFNSLEELDETFWREYLFNLDQFIVLDSKYPYEASYIGGGCPPIETQDGWLIIYHAVNDTPSGFIYHAAAALLDINNPTVEIARLKEPLFSPTETWEKAGHVNNVVFPSGSIVTGDDLFIYYGAADAKVAVASVKLSALLTELLKNKIV